MPTSETFVGFNTPKQEWFPVPNAWIDICAEISSLAEIKVVQYVMRHGQRHEDDGVSIDEFMHGRWSQDGERMDKGTGLSKPSVIAGLRSAVERGLLIEKADDHNRDKKYYSLRMNLEDTHAQKYGS